MLNFLRQQFSHGVMVSLITASVNRDVCSCRGSEWRTHWTHISLSIQNYCYRSCVVEISSGVQYDFRCKVTAWIKRIDTRIALYDLLRCHRDKICIIACYFFALSSLHVSKIIEFYRCIQLLEAKVNGVV